MLSRQRIEGLTSDLLWTLALCIGALIFDFFHYVVAAFMLGRLQEKYQDEGKVRENFITIPKRTNRPGTVLYWIKIFLLVLAFGSLVFNFIARLGPAPTAPNPGSVTSAAQGEPMVCGGAGDADGRLQGTGNP